MRAWLRSKAREVTPGMAARNWFTINVRSHDEGAIHWILILYPWYGDDVVMDRRQWHRRGMRIELDEGK